MDGDIARLKEICDLAEKYDALVMVDECHSAGVVGETGRGVTELFDIRGKVDIITGTLGKALMGQETGEEQHGQGSHMPLSFLSPLIGIWMRPSVANP